MLGNIAFEQISNKSALPGLPILAITQEHGAIPRDLIDYHVSVSEQSLTGYKVVEVGDFIISLRSFQGGIEYSKYQGICSPAYIILRSKKSEAFSYFRHYFKTEAFIRAPNRNLEGMLRETNPAKMPRFDAVVANPPFSYRWGPTESQGEDARFKNYGLAPKSAADFAFLLHGFHFLKDDGVMAIILPHGVLFRGGAEAKIRTKLLKDHHIDTVIGLPPNLFYSTGIPVCILVLKKCKKFDDVLFINAAGPEHFAKGKRQNQLLPEHIKKIVDTYQFRRDEERYSLRVPLERIEKEDYNLNISRYVSTSIAEKEIDLAAVHADLVSIEKDIRKAKDKHNEFLKELGLPLLP